MRGRRSTMAAWLVLSFFCAAVCASEARILGKVTLPGSGVQPEIELLETPGAPARTGDAGKLSLRITHNGTANTLPLASAGLASQASIRADQPLNAAAIELPAGSRAAHLTFGLEDGRGAVRSVAVLLVQPAEATAWTAAKEWVSDCMAVGELGFKREKQTFAAPKPGTLTRQARNLLVEGVAHQLDCGCIGCNSRTTEFVEDETFAWNAGTRAFETLSFEKRYVVQPGEGLMAVARKALGDARLLARLYKLNPGLKPDGILKEGEKLLVEKK